MRTQQIHDDNRKDEIMPTDLQEAFLSVSHRFVSFVESDDKLRGIVLSLAQAFLDMKDGCSSTELTTAKPGYSDDQMDFDLAERCRLKAEGCRWAAERIRLAKEEACHQTDIAPLDREIIDRAKQLCKCLLWMNHPSSPVPDDPSLFDVVGGCFEALGASVAVAQIVVAELTHKQHMLGEALQLVAEAQSALRSAIQKIDGPSDHDQIQSYQWVKSMAAERKVFIERFLHCDDLAEPSSWADILACSETLNEQVHETRGIERRRRKLLSKLKYQIEQASNADDTGRVACWTTIAKTLNDLVQTGMPPSNLEIRSLLLPHIDNVPELGDVPQGFNLAVREAKRFGDTDIEEQPLKVVSGPTADVRKVAKLLKGKTAVLIGGDCRLTRKDVLETAFGLKELVWVATKPHESVTKFETYVARPEVAVVLLAIRWCSHSYKDVKRFCERYDILLVRIPAGLHQHQVAAHILGQCGDRLKAKTPQKETIE